MQLFTVVTLQLFKQLNWQVVIGHVTAVLGEVTVNVADFRTDWQEGDLVQHGVFVVPVVWVTHQSDTLVNHVRVQLKGSVADPVLRLRPLIAKFLNRRFVNR
ncbi:Uncharacterised protein [Pantoea agglomerans]|nr:Uncharacterised protein [Pantoea agglomerans]